MGKNGQMIYQIIQKFPSQKEIICGHWHQNQLDQLLPRVHAKFRLSLVQPNNFVVYKTKICRVDTREEPAKSTNVQTAVRDIPAKCKHIELKDTERNTTEEFRLFREEDISCFRHAIFNVKLNDIQCDNDCQTENEQIEASSKYLQRELADTVICYGLSKTHVNNLRKYEKERAPIPKRRRVY